MLFLYISSQMLDLAEELMLKVSLIPTCVTEFNKNTQKHVFFFFHVN
jgi:hypothetical protein